MRRTFVGGLVVLACVALACGQQAPPRAADVEAQRNLAAAATAGARPAATRAPVATALPSVSEADKDEARRLWTLSQEKAQEREIGLAMEFAAQAIAKWPDMPNAQRSMATMVPAATAIAGQQIAQATAAARAEATQQAQAAATAAAVAANQPTKLPGCRSVAGLQVCVAIASRSRGSQFTRPAPGHEYLVLKMDIANESTEEKAFNPFDFKIADGAGVVKGHEWFGGAPSNQQLRSGRLLPSGKVSGLVSFQVPTGDVKFVVRYEAGLFSNRVLGQWAV